MYFCDGFFARALFFAIKSTFIQQTNNNNLKLRLFNTRKVNMHFYAHNYIYSMPQYIVYGSIREVIYLYYSKCTEYTIKYEIEIKSNSIFFWVIANNVHRNFRYQIHCQWSFAKRDDNHFFLEKRW